MIVAIAEKNSSAITVIDDFHIITVIAEKVNEDQGDLSRTTSFVPFVKFNMAEEVILIFCYRECSASWYYLLSQ